MMGLLGGGRDGPWGATKGYTGGGPGAGLEEALTRLPSERFHVQSVGPKVWRKVFTEWPGPVWWHGGFELEHGRRGGWRGGLGGRGVLEC